ncbi:zeta toxin family protein [Paenibacillus chitinolyticus]|uniref:zeta toxin family protein n=1 Tax=Paenibacillus chitinolyticus TaxID=79263 RepID=UPI001C443CB7|nr:zeta toxin family protein [Paenibacillus chitinolyticus]MBV6717183.1 zeta toxin family protein [Paenibacillus chitinolyticus]
MTKEKEPKLNTGSKPQMTVFAGTNGAGKSTITEVIGNRVGEVIDADAIAKQLSPLHPESVSVAAGREALKRVQSCIDQRRDFSIETTLAGGNVVRQMQRAKAAGFDITMYYVGLKNVDYHIERVARRVEQGGHSIPEEDIRRRYDRSLDRVPEALRLTDRAFVFDNSTGFKKVAEFDHGKLQIHVKQSPDWVDRIIKGWEKELRLQIKELEDKKVRYEKEYNEAWDKHIDEKQKLKPLYELESLKTKRDQLLSKLEELQPVSLIEKLKGSAAEKSQGIQREVELLESKIVLAQKKLPPSQEIHSIQQSMSGLAAVLSALQQTIQQVGRELFSCQQTRYHNALHKQYGSVQEYTPQQDQGLER